MAKPSFGGSKTDRLARNSTNFCRRSGERLYPCPVLSPVLSQLTQRLIRRWFEGAVSAYITSTSSHVPSESVFISHGSFSTRAVLIGCAAS